MTTSLPHPRVEVVASLPADDARDVADLLAVAEAADGYSSISEQALLDVEPGTGRAASSLLLRAPGTEGAGTSAADELPLVGYGVLEQAGGRWTLELVVHPARRDPAGTTERALVESGIEQVARSGGGPLSVWARSEHVAEWGWLTGHGFMAARQLFQLRAPLPVETGRRPQDRPIDVRPFHPGRDEAAWLDANRRAFADHPEQGSWTLADLEHRERAPWFDPRGFLIHEVDRRIAGFCWTKVHRTPLVGEIYVIGVDPDFQGRGLGRALTLAGLDHLATRGVPEAMLYVEGTNVAALALYRSLGFVEHHRETVYRAEVPAELAGAEAAEAIEGTEAIDPGQAAEPDPGEA